MKMHPIQPLEVDESGRLRFKENAIVKFLLENGGIDLNKLATLPFSRDDREQFAQLIGYSLDGFGELSYVSNETYDAAVQMHMHRVSSSDAARAEILRAKLEEVKNSLREEVSKLYGIHMRDLK